MKVRSLAKTLRKIAAELEVRAYGRRYVSPYDGTEYDERDFAEDPNRNAQNALDALFEDFNPFDVKENDFKKYPIVVGAEDGELKLWTDEGDTEVASMPVTVEPNLSEDYDYDEPRDRFNGWLAETEFECGRITAKNREAQKLMKQIKRQLERTYFNWYVGTDAKVDERELQKDFQEFFIDEVLKPLERLRKNYKGA